MYIYLFKKVNVFYSVIWTSLFSLSFKNLLYLWTLLFWTFSLAFLTKQNSTWIPYSLDLPARPALWCCCFFFSSAWTLKNNCKIAPVLVMAYFLAVNVQPVLSHVQLFGIAWTAEYPPTPGSCPWGFSGQEYWNGLPCSLSSRASSQPRDQTQVSHIGGRFFTVWATREAQEYWSG